MTHSTEAPIYQYPTIAGKFVSHYDMNFTVPVGVGRYGLFAEFNWTYERM